MTHETVFDYDEKQAARILGVCPRTLRTWRQLGRVGHYRTPGGRVRYTMDQLVDLQRASRVDATQCRSMPHVAE